MDLVSIIRPRRDPKPGRPRDFHRWWWEKCALETIGWLDDGLLKLGKNETYKYYSRDHRSYVKEVCLASMAWVIQLINWCPVKLSKHGIETNYFWMC